MNAEIPKEPLTRTGHGLVTIFFIGLVHQLLDIQLATASIKIPWMPEIKINDLGGITSIYMCVLAFGIFRYILHNSASLIVTGDKGLALVIKCIGGKSIIPITEFQAEVEMEQNAGRSVYFEESLYLQGANIINDVGHVRLVAYPKGRGSKDERIDYCISFDSPFSVMVAVQGQKMTVESNESNLEKLGFKSENFLNSPLGQVEHIPISPKLRYGFIFVILGWVGSVLSSLKDKDSFESLCPLYLCIGMLIYLSM